MRFWWVNQNQTYRHEITGGYLWSPKKNANGARNPFYESMREVAPGDLIFSFKDTRIFAVGIARSYCWESPKPLGSGPIKTQAIDIESFSFSDAKCKNESYQSHTRQ